MWRKEQKKTARLSTLAENERSFAAVSFPRCRISESDDSLASNKWRDYFEIEPTTPPDDFSFLRLSRTGQKTAVSIVYHGNSVRYPALSNTPTFSSRDSLTWGLGWSWPKIRRWGATKWSEEGIHGQNKEHSLLCCCWTPILKAALGGTRAHGPGRSNGNLHKNIEWYQCVRDSSKEVIKTGNLIPFRDTLVGFKAFATPYGVIPRLRFWCLAFAEAMEFCVIAFAWMNTNTVTIDINYCM